jgi:hypothetical protein
LYYLKNHFPPDFSRSVVLEGCELTTFRRPDDFLSIGETSDFGSVRSGHGVHLTGGASLYPFVGYFVKNVVTNSSARQYRHRFHESPFRT